jgi:hypothetical protein
MMVIRGERRFPCRKSSQRGALRKARIAHPGNAFAGTSCRHVAGVSSAEWDQP